VLSADGEDAARWTALVARLPRPLQDIHLLPEYGRIYRVQGFDPRLAVLETPDGIVLQAFVLRPLGALPFLAEAPDRAAFFDVANPYGFGGPVSTAEPEAGRGLYAAFDAAFTAWCEPAKVASEFCSLHPLMHETQRALMAGVREAAHEKDVVLIDLAPDEDEMVRGLRKGHRSSITLARRSGVEVAAVAASPENIALFTDIYTETMVRRDAAQRWFLPADFFSATLGELGPGRSTLLFARLDGEVEAASLVIHDFATAYYHFAGARATRPELGVNNLMVWEAALTAKRAGYAWLHLGGGVTSAPDDSLLRFKAGFSAARAPLYTYFAIRDAATYRQLCGRKIAFEESELGVALNSDFLPLYRR
jgi:hypothetical protein